METAEGTIVEESGAAGRGVDERATDRQPDDRGIIVIVARNNLHLTRAAYKSAVLQDNPCNILLIDNASTDGTTAWISSHAGIRMRGFTYTLAFEKQRSLAACWNAALRTMMSTRTIPHMLICNNDIELRPDAYHLLASSGRDFVTCVSVDSRDRLGYPETGTAARARLSSARPHPDFSCFLIRREVVCKVGYFDEAYYPAYAEDAQYHVRMHRAGVKAVCVDVPFLHHGASTLKYASPAEQAIIRRGADQNRERFRAEFGCLPGTPEYEKLFR